MNMEIPEGHFYRGNGLEPMAHADLFNPDGSISDVGIKEFGRLSKILLVKLNLPPNALPGAYILWRNDHKKKLLEPNNSSRQGSV
jgi:hypothetical protein